MKKATVDDINSGKQEFVWKGPLYDRVTPPIGYYIVLVIISLGLAALFFWARQPLSVIVVAAALLFYLTHAHETPKVHRYLINSEKIQIEDETYNYDSLKSYWFAETPAGHQLYVERLETFSFPLSIPIPKKYYSSIQALLRQRLPESRRRGELITDLVSRITGLS